MIEGNLARELFGAGAIKFGAFRLKLHEENPDAPLSPIYIDLRILRSLPVVMNLAVEAYRSLISNSGIEFDCYADVPTAATPIVAVLSQSTGVAMISPRMDAKTHGTKRKIEGIFHAGQVALLVDDLITTAGSKLEAVSVLAENGLIVHDVVVLVDREQSGVQALSRYGYACHAVFRLGELLSFYWASRLIDNDTYRRVTDYLQSQKS